MSTPILSPEHIFDTLWGFQRTAALKTGIDLGLFTIISEGAHTAADISARCGAAERGVRILCDYLTIIGLLKKVDGTYHLTAESAFFLNRTSPAYVGGTASFMAARELRSNFDELTAAVKHGGVPPQGVNTVTDNNPTWWVEFAKAMVPMAMPSAFAIAEILGVATSGPLRVLDIAAGHGMFGITLAQRNPQVDVVATDWASVLSVAEANASTAGVAGRYRLLPGDAFRVDFGTGFDVALITNFLHHFDPATNTNFLRKVHGSLVPGSRVVLLEFVPNPDRVSPPMAAGFSLAMLSGTPSGDAYTLAELTAQLTGAGFADVTAYPQPTPQTVIVAKRTS